MPSAPAFTPQPGCSGGRDQFTAIVSANIPLCRDHYRLVLRLDAFPATEPGQFVQLACCNVEAEYGPEAELEWEPGELLPVAGRELMSPLAFLRRPFSLAGRRDARAGVELDVIHRVVGIGTGWLAGLKVGDAVSVLGPLGNRFTLPRPEQLAILVGGGVGIPPMLYLAEKLAGQRAVAFCGALSRDLLPLGVVAGAENPGEESFRPTPAVVDFAQYGIPSVISTDDGSWGFRGFVTQALEKYLNGDDGTQRQTDDAKKTTDASAPWLRGSVAPSLIPPIIYTCGPESMMKRVAEIAAARGLECQVAVERAMACGMGTCQSCCIRLMRDPARDGRAFAGKDWIYKLACTDGPIFKGADLLW
jgi:dihydroorotate dehydrogenase electron transfer subunit